MTASTPETHNVTHVVIKHYRVQKLNNGYGDYYYVQHFKAPYRDDSNIHTKEKGLWVTCSRGYAHSTSAFAALGRQVQRDIQQGTKDK